MKIFLSLMAAPLAAFVNAWTLMVTAGALHHEWFPRLPTLGYWQAFLITGPLILAITVKLTYQAAIEAWDD